MIIEGRPGDTATIHPKVLAPEAARAWNGIAVSGSERAKGLENGALLTFVEWLARSAHCAYNVKMVSCQLL